ncbi:MAG: histidyl-tRNA synthetase [Patescibacteria group bacterium]|nr:histidyl-tRNA synthetase [Patescibacteria group bacterium]
MPRRKKAVSDAPVIRVTRKNDKLPTRLLGMKDFSYFEQACFDFALSKAHHLARVYGFKSIKTPILESFDLYKKTVRFENEKEIYNVDGDKGEKAVLRPEITQGIIRSYLENNQEIENKVARLYSIGPVFRREKLQSGYYRESTQFDLEVIGARKPMIEALLIALASNFFSDMQVEVQLQINSIGDLACRKEYCAKLVNFYKERGKKSKLCTACKNNLPKNCLSLLDCKQESCVKLREGAPQIADFLSEASRDYFTKTLEILDELKINYNFNPYLVRGLNYYNDIVFEFWPINKDGSVGNLALAGGGRYDNLIENLGGPSLPASGLAFGLERIVSRVRDKAALTNQEESDIVFIAQLGDQAKLKALQLSNELLALNFNVRQSLITDSLKEQLEEAVKLKAKVCLILGKKEIMDGTILMRDIDSGAQETIVFKKVKERLAKKMSS